MLLSYLADEDECEAAAENLAKIVGYERRIPTPSFAHEQKHPDSIFLGIPAGSLISLADKKAFRPTHPELRAYYGESEPIADHLR